jgi:protein-disulfide isomerase
MELGNKVEVRGTPTFYLNGKKTMARSLEGFKKEIDEILNNKK